MARRSQCSLVMIGYKARYNPLAGPYSSDERREFTRNEVALVGKVRRYGDSVKRFIVRLYDGQELLILGTEQTDEDRKWIHRIGLQVPSANTSRDVPYVVTWVNVPEDES